ncbi:MAG: 3-oxoacyl-ACP reductase family protein [Vampirovibrionales bacterium]
MMMSQTPASSSLLLAGKQIFVSGGSRGIGKALCEVFAREGANVAFNYASNDDAAQETLQLIESHGVKGMKFKASVTDRDAMKAMAKEVLAAFDGRLDVLVNSAAINRADMFLTTTESAWDSIMDVNVNGLFNVTKAFYKTMLKQRAGHILNITSIGGIRALPTSVHYATSKAAVVGFTKCLSREASAFGVSVNAIAAGIFDTDLGHSLPDQFQEVYNGWCSKKRFGHPKELAEFAAFMVSDRNTYMNGEVITIDGGTVL